MCRYLDCAAMAAQLGLSEYTLRKWARLGKVPARKLGKDWQFDPERVERSLDSTSGNDLTRQEVSGR